jgi:hypothetical protein
LDPRHPVARLEQIAQRALRSFALVPEESAREPEPHLVHALALERLAQLGERRRAIARQRRERDAGLRSNRRIGIRERAQETGAQRQAERASVVLSHREQARLDARRARRDPRSGANASRACSASACISVEIAAKRTLASGSPARARSTPQPSARPMIARLRIERLPRCHRARSARAALDLRDLRGVCHARDRGSPRLRVLGSSVPARARSSPIHPEHRRREISALVIGERSQDGIDGSCPRCASSVSAPRRPLLSSSRSASRLRIGVAAVPASASCVSGRGSCFRSPTTARSSKSPPPGRADRRPCPRAIGNSRRPRTRPRSLRDPPRRRRARGADPHAQSRGPTTGGSHADIVRISGLRCYTNNSMSQRLVVFISSVEDPDDVRADLKALRAPRDRGPPQRRAGLSRRPGVTSHDACLRAVRSLHVSCCSSATASAASTRGQNSRSRGARGGGDDAGSCRSCS